MKSMGEMSDFQNVKCLVYKCIGEISIHIWNVKYKRANF
jgi:hypothetical protein